MGELLLLLVVRMSSCVELVGGGEGCKWSAGRR